MRIALCDDEQDSLDKLACCVEHYGQSRHLGLDLVRYQDGEALLADIAKGQAFDLLFLDIYMGTLDGLSLAKRIRELDKGCGIIFATSSTEHAIAGYGVRALYYLLKPFDQAAVEAALDQVLDLVQKPQEASIQVQNRLGVYRIPLGDLVYAESKARVVTIHTTGLGEISYYDRLDNLTSNCNDPRFLRCHKSFLVNLDFVRGISGSAFLLETGEEVRISMRLSAAREAFVNHAASRIGQLPKPQA